MPTAAHYRDGTRLAPAAWGFRWSQTGG